MPKARATLRAQAEYRDLFPPRRLKIGADSAAESGIGAKFDRVVCDLRFAKLFAQCDLDP
jgi:hypothetical protein